MILVHVGCKFKELGIEFARDYAAVLGEVGKGGHAWDVVMFLVDASEGKAVFEPIDEEESGHRCSEEISWNPSSKESKVDG